ncbi:unnamed protein product [Prunus armeniaca]
MPNGRRTVVEFSLTSCPLGSTPVAVHFHSSTSPWLGELGDYMITIGIRWKTCVLGSERRSSRTSKSPTKKSLLDLFVPYLTPHSRYGTWTINKAGTSSVGHAERLIGILHCFILGRQVGKAPTTGTPTNLQHTIPSDQSAHSADSDR